MNKYTSALKKFSQNRFGALLCNLTLAMLLFMVARAVFIACNWDKYSGHMDSALMLDIFKGGLRFDLATLFYINGLYIVLYLLPLHLKETRLYYAALKILFTVANALALMANLADCVYVRWTGRRTTATIFSEFANEDNTLKIIGTELTNNLLLLLLFIVAVWAMWKLYRKPVVPSRRNPITYYASSTAALAIAVLVAIASIRGGLDRTTRPITLSNANQYVNRPIEAAAVLNTPFSIIRSAGKPAFDVPPYMDNHEAETLYSPLHLPADSVGEFRPMNVVILIVESFSRAYIGALNRELNDSTYRGYTPFTDSLITQARTYRHSFANGMKSIDGMPSVLSGIPMMIEPFFLTPAALNDMGGIAYYLKDKGYTSAFFHGAPNGSMGFEAFARRSGFDRYVGLDEYCQSPDHNGRDDFDGSWAIWDEPFLQFYAEEMSRMPQPFVTSVFTASSHHPFAIPSRYRDLYPEEGDHPLLKCIRYTDSSIGRFFETARKQPWFGNTLFVITSDHSMHPIAPKFATGLGQYASPIIFFAPSDPTMRGIDTCRVAQQTDILPTVLNYLNYDRPYVAFGVDLFNTPPDSTWAFSYNSGMYQYACGDYFMQFDGDRVKSVFRFRDDEELRDNLAATLPDSVIVPMETRLKAFIQQYARAMKENHLLP